MTLLIAILCVTFAMTMLFACARTPDIPVPTGLDVTSGVFTWDAVDGAIRYEVYVDDEVFTVYETSYALDFSDEEEHTLSVAAVTVDGTSAKSLVVLYKANGSDTDASPDMLPAPTEIRMTGNRLIWNNVAGNVGYKIYVNGALAATVGRDVRQYDSLTFPSDGNYVIRIQTLGDGLTYHSSLLSNSCGVKIENGVNKSKDKLSVVRIGYDVATKSLVWENARKAQSVRYEIYREGSLVAEYEATDKPRMSHALTGELNGARVSYTMRLVSNDDYYDPSDYSEAITFPLSEPAVMNLRLEREETGAVFRWDDVTYYLGYSLELDGVSRSTVNGVALPNLSAGRHVARVRTVGDGIFYSSSPYSREIVFYTDETGLVPERLSAPTALTASVTTDTLTVTFDEVENATEYLLAVTAGESVWRYVLDGNSVLFDKDDDPTLTDMLAAANAGAYVNVYARSSSAAYADSPRSLTVCVGKTERITAPTMLEWTAGGITWAAVDGAEGYEVEIDGTVYTTTEARYVPAAMEPGEHFVRVRVLSETPACYSEEQCCRLPFELDAPHDLIITSGVLSFAPSDGCSGYVLYADGVQVGETISLFSTTVSLASYFRVDGRYVLSLRAISSAPNGSDSVLSEEILYVKSDSAYGTVTKPYPVNSAAEFLSLVKAHPDAYFTLTESSYDFTGLDLSALAETKFAGYLIGNGATLTGLKPRAPLFAEIKAGAVMEDLTIEMDLSAFPFDETGVLSASMTEATLVGVTFVLSTGETPVAGGTFGLLMYEAEDCVLTDVNVTADLAFTSTESITVSAIAHSFSGRATRLATSGKVVLSAKEAVYSGVFHEGSARLEDCSIALSFDATAEERLYIAGGSAEGRSEITGGTFGGNSRGTADSITHYGVGGASATITNGVNIGGAYAFTARVVESYGVAAADFSLSEVTVSSRVTANATSTLTLAGITNTINGSVSLSDVTFAGNYTGTAPTALLSGGAVTAETPFSLTMAGALTASGRNVTLVGFVQSGAGGDYTYDDGKLTLKNVTNARVAGGAITSAGELSLSGDVTFTAKEGCETLSVSGIVLRENVNVAAEGYSLTGEFSATDLTFGGIAVDARRVEGSVTDMTVTLGEVSATRFTLAGGVVSMTEYALDSASLEVNIRATGEGALCGFAVDYLDGSISNVRVSGALSLMGEGDLCGVARRVGSLTGIVSSVSLEGKGDVALAGVAQEAYDLSAAVNDATYVLVSDEAELYGVGRSITGVCNVTLNNVKTSVSPATEGGSALVYGVTTEIGTDASVTMVGGEFYIGAYETARFAAVAGEASGDVANITLAYSLEDHAASSEIGGAFINADANVAVLALGTQLSPVVMTLAGDVQLGGASLLTSGFTASSARVYLDLDASLSGSDENVIGGLFGKATGEVTLGDGENYFTLVGRSGSALVGGAVAALTDTITGARTNANISFASNTLAVGGVVGRADGGTVRRAASRGSINAADAGGIAGEMISSSVLSECSSAVTLTGARSAGLASKATSSSLSNAYSIATVKEGAGIVYVGDGVTLRSVWFAGDAAYSVAKEIKGESSATTLLVDAALRSLTAIDTGSLPVTYKTISFGYEGDDLDGDIWTTGKENHPYLKEVGLWETSPTVKATSLAVDLVLEDGDDLYALLSDRIFVEGYVVVWRDAADSDTVQIVDGRVTLNNDASGTLYGYISGGKNVYTVSYRVDGFVPFEGEGTSDSPYILSKFDRFKLIPAVAAEYYETNGALAYFSLPSGEYEEIVLPEITGDFAAHVLCAGAILRAPSIPTEGIFGTMTGGSVSGLTIEDPVLEGGAVLLTSATDVSLEGITLRTSEDHTDLALADTMAGGSVTNVSLRLDGETEAAYVVRTVDGTAFECVQLYAEILLSDASIALVKEADDATFEKCLFVACAAGTADIAAFAESATDVTFSHSAVIAYMANGGGLSLVRSATGVTYEGCSVAFNGTSSAAVGVTAMGYGEIRAALLAAPYSFEAGAIPTPVGYASFGLGAAEGSFIIKDGSGEIADALEISDETEILLSERFFTESASLFGMAVTFTTSEPFATVSNGVLRITGTGSGDLVATNVYGSTVTITLTVTNYIGFSGGAGTEEDPYEIDSFEQLVNTRYYEYAHYELTKDLKVLFTADDERALPAGYDGRLSEPLRFSGELDGNGHTLTVTLDGMSLFAECDGVLSDLAIDLTVTDGVTGGLLIGSASGLTLADVTVTVDDLTLDAAEEGSYGVLFNEMDGCTLQDFTATFGSVDASLAGGTAGLLAGKFNNVTATGLTLTATDVTVTATGDLAFGGVVGEMKGSDSEASDWAVTLTAVLTTAEDKDVSVGGAVGRAKVDLTDVEMTVTLTLNGVSTRASRATIGGAVGESENELSSVTVTGSITAYAERAFVGGAVGYITNTVRDATANAVILAETTERAYVGGVIGRTTSDAYRLRSEGNVTVTSHTTETIILEEDEIPVLVAAGGVAGCGELHTSAAIGVTVTAEAAYTGTDRYVAAGGVVGYLPNGSDLEARGVTVSATGAKAASGGAVGILERMLENVVVSSSSAAGTGATSGGVVGIYSLTEDSYLGFAVCTSALLSDAPAIAGDVVYVDEKGAGVIGECYFTSGVLTSAALDGDHDYNNNGPADISDISDLYGDTIYTKTDEDDWSYFSADDWSFAADRLPVLRG